MTTQPDPGLAARPLGRPLVARTVAIRGHRRGRGAGRPRRPPVAAAGPRAAAGLELGASRRRPGRLGPRRGVHRTGCAAVRRRRGVVARRGVERGGARRGGHPGHRPGRLRLGVVCRGLPCGGHARRARGRRRLPRRQVVADHGRRSLRAPHARPAGPGAAARARGRHVLRRRPVPRAVGGAGLRGGVAHHRRPARQGGAGPGPRRARRGAGGPALAAPAAGRALRHDVGLRRRRPRGRHARDAGAPREGPGHLPRARRDHPAHRRRRARPGAGGLPRALLQGPRGARVRRALGGRRAAPALLVDERAGVALRAAPQQRDAPGHRRRRVLNDATTSLALAASLHPSAAVCGTPTAVADEVIAELEEMDRGRYAGPVGWMDAAGDGEWGIALRCGAYDPADPAQLRLFAGAASWPAPIPSRRSRSPTPSSCPCATPCPEPEPPVTR